MNTPHTFHRDRNTVLPPSDLEQMLDLSRFLGDLPSPAMLLGPDGQQVPLPEEAFEILCKVADAMRMGKAITVAPVDQLLTTQEAANFLGISRPTLIKLLEGGQIPFQKPAGGKHRRVTLQHLVAYQDEKKKQRREALDALTADAAANGLYETTPDTYESALKQARRDAGGARSD